MGPRRPRPGDHQPRSDTDALLDVSVPGAALDRPARRVEAADDLPARQAIDGHVPALLSRRAGAVVSLRHGGVLRDDCVRHRSLLLIQHKGISGWIGPPARWSLSRHSPAASWLAWC